MKSPRDHALGLLRKAANDLVAARATLTTGQALDTVCFHAQQAAEKSLKSLLALKDIVYPWRHVARDRGRKRRNCGARGVPPNGKPMPRAGRARREPQSQGLYALGGAMTLRSSSASCLSST